MAAVDGTAVWITGMGAVSPAGWSVRETWDRLLDGKSCVQTLRRFPLYDACTRVGAPVQNREEVALNTSLSVEFGRAAATEALGQAGLAPESGQIDVLILGTHGERRMPLPGERNSFDAVNMIVSDLRDFAGATTGTGVYGACASGAMALGSAVKLIAAGQVDVALAGGADTLLREVDYFSICSLYAMTSRECPPEEASCPFDSRRDGFVMAEGAALLVLESERHARARGADPLAVIEGVGLAQNAYHMTASPPDALGPEYAMRGALDNAGLDPGDIDYISAHGTSTRDNDWCETLAIRQAFGPRADEVPVSSNKSVLGHLMAAAGAIETVMCVTALQDQVVPATMNLQNPDPNCDLDYVPGQPRQRRLTRVMNNSFGFGGHSACLIVGALP